MDQLNRETPFVRFVAEALKGEGFVLIDVGAANGIATAWHAFGTELRGFGFDPNVQEVERLNRIETALQFRYVAGYVGLPPDHVFARQRAGRARLERNPWDRLAVQRWSNIQSAAETGAPVPPTPQRPIPLFKSAERTEEYSPIIYLPDFLKSAGVAEVDFIKIDVDGLDLEVAQSMAQSYRHLAVLGVGIEVNFFGSDSETCNTFHNVDRLLKGQEFELFDIGMRRYPTQDLPGPSIVGHPYPGDSGFGRPLQGDAFYARDVCAFAMRDFAKSLTEKKVAKLAALFAMFGLPDCAAEILVTFRERLTAVLNVDRGLDLLAAQAQQASSYHALSYNDYMAAFESASYKTDKHPGA